MLSIFLKPPFFNNILLIGIRADSLQTFEISAPENPSVYLTNISQSIVSSILIFYKFKLKSSLLPFSLGNGITN